MYIITSKTRRRVSRDPKFHAAARQEKNAILAECGVQSAVPVKGAPEMSLEHAKQYKAKIAESMAASKEAKAKEDAAKARERERNAARMVKQRGQELAEKHRAGVLGKA